MTVAAAREAATLAAFGCGARGAALAWTLRAETELRRDIMVEEG